MKKTRKKHDKASSALSAKLDEAERKNDLRGAILAKHVFDIECAVCGEPGSIDDDNDFVTTKQQAANKFKKDGWVYRTSKYFGCIGAHCPDCAAMTDKELGERDA